MVSLVIKAIKKSPEVYFRYSESFQHHYVIVYSVTLLVEFKNSFDYQS